MPFIIVESLLFVLCVIGFLIHRVKVSNLYSILFKGIASFMFISIALTLMIYVKDYSLYNIFIILGLTCGLAGDVLLDFKVFKPEHDLMFLNLGYLAFGIGHGFYLTSMIMISNQKFDTSIVNNNFLIAIFITLAILIAFFITSLLLKFDMKNCLIQSGLYLIILAYVMGFACVMFITSKFSSFSWAMILFFL